MQPALQGLRPVGLCLDTALQFLDAWSNADEALVKAEGEVKIRDYIVSTVTSAGEAQSKMQAALNAPDHIDRLTQAERLADEYVENAKGGADHTMEKNGVVTGPGAAFLNQFKAQVDAYWEAIPKTPAMFQQQFAEAFAKLSGYEGGRLPGTLRLSMDVTKGQAGIATSIVIDRMDDAWELISSPDPGHTAQNLKNGLLNQNKKLYESTLRKEVDIVLNGRHGYINVTGTDPDRFQVDTNSANMRTDFSEVWQSRYVRDRVDSITKMRGSTR